MTQDYPANALPRGYQIKNYRIVDVLGVGGYGITYLAEDIQLKTKVAIKEYLPSDLAVRGNTHSNNSSESNHSTLNPKSKADKETYLWGLERFLNEAQAVASLKHRNIVQVKHFFEANNTAYFVMDYEEGEALNKLLKKGERVEEDEIYKLTLPLLDGLKKVHDKNYLHRDISPSNIYIQDDGDNPILIDFGAARQSLVGKSHSMSSIVKVGYAPYEQYQTRGNQGPWSDIYAFGAVLYQLISGSVPVESTERVNAMVNNLADPLTPAVEIGKGKYSKKLLRAIDWALSIREKDRPQNINQWIVALKGKKTAAPAKANAHSKPVPPTQNKIKVAYLILGFLILSSLIFAGWFFSQSSQTKEVINAKKESQKLEENISKLEDLSKNTLPEKSNSVTELITEPELVLEPETKEANLIPEVEEQPKSKAEKLEVACLTGIMQACYIAGLYYDEGKSIKQNYPKAKKYYEQACDEGTSKACLMLGLMYGQGHGVKQNFHKAAALYKKSCDDGLPQGCEIYEKIKPLLK
jgi:serine/threonine protein kinase